MNKYVTYISAVIAVILIACVVFFGVKYIENKRATTASLNQTVKIGAVTAILSSALPLDVALEDKQFEKRNIKTETVGFASANLLVDALVRGDVDITPFDSVFPFLSAEVTDPGKIKLFAVSDLTPDVRFDAILVQPNSPINNLKDLSGKKIGVFPGSTTTAFLKAYLTNNNIDISKTTFVQIPPQDQIQALQSKSVDALYALEPTFSIATVQAGFRILDQGPYAKLFNHTPIGGGLISSKFVNQNPLLAKSTIETFQETYQLMQTNDALVRQVAQEKFNLKPNTAAIVGIPAMTAPDPESFSRFVDLVISVGELKQKPDLSSIYYK